MRSRIYSMDFKIVILFCVIQVFELGTAQVGGLSSKLDFGNTEHNDGIAPKNVVKTVVSVHQSSKHSPGISSKLGENPFNFHAISRAADHAVDQVKGDFKGLSLVCVDGGCNTTEIKSKEGELNTDIVVQVTTNLKQNTSDHIQGNEENSDVPVVLGTAGMNDLELRKIDQGNILIPSTTPVFVPYNVNQNLNPPKHHIPHFEPNYNNHYFGESPPPMYVWYKTRNTGHNPQAFNTNWQVKRPANDWQRSYTSNYQGNTYNVHRHNTPNGWTPSTVCTCTNPGLNWYPSNDDKAG